MIEEEEYWCLAIGKEHGCLIWKRDVPGHTLKLQEGKHKKRCADIFWSNTYSKTVIHVTSTTSHSHMRSNLE